MASTCPLYKEFLSFVFYAQNDPDTPHPHELHMQPQYRVHPDIPTNKQHDTNITTNIKPQPNHHNQRRREKEIQRTQWYRARRDYTSGCEAI
jgi:hypothetical protein